MLQFWYDKLITLLSTALLVFTQTIKQIVWHRQGDYLAVVTDGASATSTVVIHRLSKRQSQVIAAITISCLL